MPHAQDAGQPWDLIVVGAGPAGAATALLAARAGLRTLLVDAKKFPRRKACGGCLNARARQLLEQLLGKAHAVLQSAQPLHEIQLSFCQQTFPFPLPAGLAVDRAALDQALAESAQEAGACFLSPATARLESTGDSACRVSLVHGAIEHHLAARDVVLAGGLGGTAAGAYRQLQPLPAAGSRIGIEAVFSRYPSHYAPQAIHMAVGRQGYVGLTRLGDQRLHVAAAVDRKALQRHGPQELSRIILREAGVPSLPGQPDGGWHGTPPLTAKAPRVASQRVFVVGDAASYAEPFTGEGIRWALEGALALVPLLIPAQPTWDPQRAREWERWYARTILRRQRICRCLAFTLRQPATRWMAQHLIRFQPHLANFVIRRLNQESYS